ncbi:MAG: toxin-antitoxin system YwqK family antitoxin [Fluviicola sp.]
MKLAWIVFCPLLIWGCSSDSDEGKKGEKDKNNTEQIEEQVDPKDLVEVVGSKYTEYYDAAKTKIKFQGEQDENKERHGRWVFYSESGKELSVSHYKNGVLHGFMQVKRPNGSFHYHGDFEDGERVGVWKFYDEKGEMVNEINYDEK